MRVPAWEDNWQARLTERLAARGFSTIGAFADSQPQASRHALADELSEEIEVGGTKTARDLAPVQILWALLDEAKSTGTVERRARDLFARDLTLPDGWPPARGAVDPAARKPLVRALTSWASGIGTHLSEYEQTINEVADALLADDTIPAGWLPSSADDPLLLDLFRRHWKEPARGQR